MDRTVGNELMGFIRKNLVRQYRVGRICQVRGKELNSYNPPPDVCFACYPDWREHYNEKVGFYFEGQERRKAKILAGVGK